MKIPRKQVETVKLSIRLTKQLHTELSDAADAQAWSLNSEINHRLRAIPVLDQLRELSAEVARLRALLEERSD